MTLSYIDQSADTLKLSIVEGEIDESEFNILTREEASFDGCRIVARVIGASHLISLETPRGITNEVLACIEVEDAHCTFSNPLQAIQGRLRLKLKGVEDYQFLAKTVPVNSTEDWLDKMLRGKQEIFRTLYEFPGLPGQIIPKTEVVICHGYGMLFYHTIHLYPNEGVSVVSTTEIKYREDE